MKNVKQIENFQIEIEYVDNSELKNVVLSSKSPTDSIEISQSLNSILNSYRKMRSEIEEAGKESKLSEVKFKNYIRMSVSLLLCWYTPLKLPYGVVIRLTF